MFNTLKLTLKLSQIQEEYEYLLEKRNKIIRLNVKIIVKFCFCVFALLRKNVIFRF